LNCFGNVHKSWAGSLENGFALSQAEVNSSGHGKRYHPALDTIVLINEPELKFTNASSLEVFRPLDDYTRAVVSALDGVLSAERDAGVQGADAIRFTATVSYAPCPTCASFESLQALGCCVACGGDLTPCEAFGEVGQKMKCPEGVHKADGTDDCPALAQMLDLHRAMVDPSSVGYKPLTPDFAEQYAKRFVFSLDWFSPSDFIMPQFLDKYMQLEFNKGKSAAEMVPVFFGAFHDHTANTAPLFESSLQTLTGVVQDQSNPLYGFNIYEYQVAYNKACNETQLDEYASGTLAKNPCPQRGFGLFELGDFKVGRTGRLPSGTQQDS
jgi:hypothetical protein